MEGEFPGTTFENDSASTMDSGADLTVTNTDAVEDETYLDDDNVETIEDNSASSSAIISPLHGTILAALKSSAVLAPVNIQVRNDSYWYYSRKQLHARNHVKLVARHNSNSFRYEAFAYKMKPRDEDLKVVPQLQFLSSHHSRLQAIKKSEAFCKERDANPADNKAFASFLDGSKLMQTHFRIQVVSEVFYRLTNFQRVCMILEQINTALAVSSDHRPTAGLGLCAPTSLKLGSVYGPHCCQLALLRVVLPAHPLTLTISAKTPSQWRPEIYSATVMERFGSSGVGSSSLRVPAFASTAALRKRIKMLAHSADQKAASFLPPIDQHHNRNIVTTASMDSVGVIDVSGATRGKTGGVFGHFFADLNPSVKAMVLERSKANKELIQREAFSVDVSKPNFKGKNSVGVKKPKARFVAGEYDKGTHSETEMLEDVIIHMKMVERLAIRMQRLRRQKVVIAAQKWLWRRQYSVLTIQRVCRGWFARKFVWVYSAMLPLAIVRIQRCYRKYRSRNLINVWAWACLRMSRVVIPKLKSFFLNCVRRWFRVRYRSVASIQAMVRMHIVRCKYFRLLGARHNAAVCGRAALQIQRVFRGKLGRAVHAGMIDWEIIVRVDVPAATRIQRVYRGYLGKLRSVYQRKYLRAARMLQACIRHFVHRRWYQQIRVQRLRQEAAVVIQRVYRGRLDREIARRLEKNRRFIEVVIPAVVFVQKYIRGYLSRTKYVGVRDRFRAAICIQKEFRRYQKRLALLAKWRALMVFQKNQVAATIQKIIRGRLARLHFKRLVLERQGRVTLAGKIIIRAWLNFKHAKRMQFLLDANRVNIYTKKLARIGEVRKELEMDRAEILADIDHAKKAMSRSKEQIHKTEQFLMEIQLRLPRIKTELVSLTQQDAESGWPEALRHEYEALAHQGKMGKEELRIRRAGLLKLESEVERLHFELEECYVELDSLTAIELENFEALRRAEVGLIERKVNHKHSRLIRVEKCRWRVDSTRLKVITRKQEEHLLPRKQALGIRNLAFSETISFEKRAEALDKEELMFEKIKKLARKLPSEKTYTAYSQPVQKTYDIVLGSSLSLLRNFTLDERANRMKKAHTNKQLAKKKRGLGQFSTLKSESELAAIAEANL